MSEKSLLAQAVDIFDAERCERFAVQRGIEYADGTNPVMVCRLRPNHVGWCINQDGYWFTPDEEAAE